MADELKPGDRVTTRTGEAGTVVRVNGGIAQVKLDSSIQKAVAIAALKKIASASSD